MRRVLIALVTLLAARESVAAQPAQRPVVLLVHGRGQLGRDLSAMRRDALEALQSGARETAGDSIIGAGDLQLVWYADLMDSRSRASTSTACAELSDLDGARRSETINGVTFLAAIASAILDAAAGDSSAGESMELRGLGGDLRYLSNPDTRCAAELRIARAVAAARVANRPVVLVSHSLGAMVSWGYLTHRAVRDDADGPIARWITLGSPVGSAELRQLVFGDESIALSLPRGVGSWVNVSADGDPFAARILGQPGSDTRALPKMFDVQTATASADAHQMTSYLRDPVGAQAVLGAWCAAFTSVDEASGCTRIRDAKP